MECHLKGKRHCRFAEEQRKRKEDSECSIFVRGFPPGTTDHQLKLFFNRFGMVTNVFLEKERGQFAFIKFQSPETVSAVLSPQFGPVYIGNCRLTIKLREY
ncbi:Speckle targeted PIP5K1A-regulated poly(A) polymerase, partial [Lamellibrachia satsuma]